MRRGLDLVVGTALVVAGVVLVLGYAESELGWFTGRPLGVVLVVLGVLDLGSGLLRRRRRDDS